MKKYISGSEAETQEIAEKFASQLKSGSVVALSGDLGAGKTAFVKGIAKHFSADCGVSSPTFTIVNEYNGDIDIYHFDAYRLEGADISQCDWIDDYLFGDGICVIEWAEYIKDILPENTLYVKILKNAEIGDNYREIITEP